MEKAAIGSLFAERRPFRAAAPLTNLRYTEYNFHRFMLQI
jgi:hypothetical protein